MTLLRYFADRFRMPAGQDTDTGNSWLFVQNVGPDGTPGAVDSDAEAEYATGYETGANLDSAGTTWTSFIANGSSKVFRVLSLWNYTDGAIEVSFDGGTTVHGRVPRGGSWTVDFKANSLTETGAVHIREFSSLPVAVGGVIGNAVWVTP